MILARAPLRISLAGGGTDLDSYSSQYGGLVLSAAIDKYVYVGIHSRFIDKFLIRYSKTEEVETIDEIQHTIVREALSWMEVKERNLEITSLADIPAGTGMGSSGSFAVALLKALAVHRNVECGRIGAASVACEIEIDILKEHVGRQDQYIAAYGGLQQMDFKGERVRVSPIAMADGVKSHLEESLLLFFLGYAERSASATLEDQDRKTRDGDTVMIQNLHRVKELAISTRDALKIGDMDAFTRAMRLHWNLKRERPGLSTPDIDDLYTYAMQNGAEAGKLVGAGGGGFLLLYAREQERLRQAMTAKNIKEVRFRFDNEGARVLFPR